MLAFTRRARDCGDWLLVVLNFMPTPRESYRIGAPQVGRYRELLNTDAALYGGSNLGNLGAVIASAVSCDGYPQSLLLTLPPLGAVVLKADWD